MSSTAAESAVPKRPTILVVDDTPANLDMLSALLEEQGYEVLAAASGELALRIVAQSRPDLVLLDVMMTGIDGYETCRQLKSLPEMAALPVLFISALDEVSDVVRGFEAGGVD